MRLVCRERPAAINDLKEDWATVHVPGQVAGRRRAGRAVRRLRPEAFSCERVLQHEPKARAGVRRLLLQLPDEAAD